MDGAGLINLARTEEYRTFRIPRTTRLLDIPRGPAYIAVQEDYYADEGVHVALREGCDGSEERLRRRARPGAAVPAGRRRPLGRSDRQHPPIFWFLARSGLTDLTDLAGQAQLGGYGGSGDQAQETAAAGSDPADVFDRTHPELLLPGCDGSGGPTGGTGPPGIGLDQRRTPHRAAAPGKLPGAVPSVRRQHRARPETPDQCVSRVRPSNFAGAP